MNLDLDEDLTARCSACGFPNDPKVRRGGGAYTPKISTETDVGGATIYFTDPTTPGCAFCHCPIWDEGGRLGTNRR